MLPQRLLGQHFLKNPSLLEKLIEISDLSKKDVVVEIGAGMGDLTGLLTKNAKFVYSYELDSELFSGLCKKFSSINNLKIQHINFLKQNFEELYREAEQRLKVVANIPYKITTPLLLKFIRDINYIDECSIMMQKEVAERISSGPGNKNYGSLTVLLNTYFIIKIMKYIKRGAFTPPPKVDSAFVKLIPLRTPLIGREKAMAFSRFLKTCFSKRRKTLHNILKSMKREDVLEVLERLKIPPDARPENLTVHNFVELCNLIT